MMSPERWQEVKRVLHDALEREPSERGAFLAAACAGDEELRQEVDALLASHDEAGSFFDAPRASFAAQTLIDLRADSLVGRSLGPYKVLSLLGKGGMGEVYLAEDARLGRNVALKLLPPFFTQDRDRLRRFQQEASAASRLNHPNILTIYDVGQFESTHYIATEHIDGVTLRDLMRRKQITTGEALDIVIQAASALTAAHAAGIVHRDIKPENIMLRPDGYLKILDFGLAKLTRNAEETWGGAPQPHTRTKPGLVMGTVTYMSPEQARGLDVDGRTDVWSLGVVLFEMLSHHAPFDGGSTADVVSSILQRDVPPLPLHLDASLPDLERVVRRMLAKDRERRYPLAADVAGDLREIRNKLQGGDFHRQSHTEKTQPLDQSTQATLTNLSAPLPAIVGRAAEIAAIDELLRQDDVNLVTLIGPGGTGKTRLSQQVARGLLAAFADGVFLVPLAPIADHQLLAATIARTLGVQETRERSFAEGLSIDLRDKNMLLVLDNFEHILTAAPLVRDLLSGCPRLKVLVTSRAPLRIGGEREFGVPPLALPAQDDVQSAERVMQSAAAALFMQRLLEVRPQFTLTDENARVVAEICIRLDGLPLALELAAARTKLLSLDEMLTRMTHPLHLLKGGDRDLPARQQTMRDTIGWSHDLLSADEKALLRRHAVFDGGSTLLAAEAVCGAAGGAHVGVLDALDALVDGSLVQKRESADGSYRFLMLETIREFGLEQLGASGEDADLRRAHATYFLQLAEEAEPHLMSAGREAWLTRLDAEHNNLRAALRWSADQAEIGMGLRLVGALRWFWYFRGHIGEGYQWARQFLAMTSASTATAARAKALVSGGSLAFYFSDPGAAAPLMEESVALWRTLGDERGLAYALVFTSLPVSISRGDFEAARAFAEESVTLLRRLGDRWGLALALNYAGVILWTDPSLEERATACFEESVALFTELGDGWGVSGALLYLAALRQEHGENATARALYEEFLVLARASKDTWRLASGLDIFAELLRSEGAMARADELSNESLILQRKLGRSLNLRKTWDRMKRSRGRS